MSNTFCLVCDDKRLHLWVGQGSGSLMSSFYSGEADTMRLLGEFLKTTQGCSLRLVDSEFVPDDYTEMSDDYAEMPDDHAD